MAGLQEDAHYAKQQGKDKHGRRRAENQYLPYNLFRYLPENVHKKAQNTFILALDGDVDFKPDAVRLLVDQMKTNPKVASTCGRIHPIGNGPVVWFQQFEYAIGHWLQKAAEHIYGCVLCSPGCFSLFRASSLMDDNVMRRYIELASTPREVVQFDQGEDRWLCTLLLQQGYKVTYCAAADALTYAPETFHEFYNQRRRWMPSTMANITDLLASYKNTVRVNDNISYLYMMYQFTMFFASILGPGTVLMMIAGSFNSVLGTNLWHSNILAFEPIAFFVLVCFTTTPNTHILVAQLMSAVYTVVMTVVIVGTIINAATESLTSPNVVFLVTLCGFFLLAGLLHPQEILCLLPGIIYFLVFPTAYLLLPLYSLCNLNVVSWGTREKAQRKTKEEMEREKKEEEERQQAKKNKRGVLNWLGLSSFINDLKEFYNTMLGRHIDEKEDATDALIRRLDEIETATPAKDPTTATQRNELREILNRKKNQGHIVPDVKSRTSKKTQPKEEVKQEAPKRDDMVNPAWLEADAVGEGDLEHLGTRELAFWRMLIKIHLLPIVKDKEKERVMENDLKSMRTNIVFGFLMLNFLWAVMIFQMQLLKEALEEKFFIPIPRADNPDETMLFEPLGFAFLAVFGVILLLQFVGTLLHRWDTFLHIIARTEIHPTENTLEGKLKTAEKLQSFGSDADEEFDIPPPDYDEPVADYEEKEDSRPGSSDDSAYSDNPRSSPKYPKDHHSRGQIPFKRMPSRDPHSSLPSIHGNSHVGYDRRGQFEPPRLSGPDPYKEQYRHYPGPSADQYQRQYRNFPSSFTELNPGPTGHRYARQHKRLGQVRVGQGHSLHRNFQRRYKHLIRGISEETSRHQHPNRQPGDQHMVEIEPRRNRPQNSPTFDDLYRTLRLKNRPREAHRNQPDYPPPPYRYPGRRV